MTRCPCFRFFLSEISKCKLDLGLLIDTTRSIKYTNLPKLRKALASLVNQFDISPEGTHVSLETFDRTSTLHNTFNDSRYYSNKAVDDLINNRLEQLNMPTRLDKALGTAKNVMFTEGSGQRAGVRSAMVLFTDGKSHPDTEDFFLDIVALKASSLLSSYINLIINQCSPNWAQLCYVHCSESVLQVWFFRGRLS